MSRRDDSPSVRIIEHTRYIIEKRNLLCEVSVSNPKLWVDLQSKTVRLYYPQGKAFLLETVSDLTGRILGTKIITEKQAKSFMNKHPNDIKEEVYIRFFGEPKQP